MIRLAAAPLQVPRREDEKTFSMSVRLPPEAYLRSVLTPQKYVLSWWSW